MLDENILFYCNQYSLLTHLFLFVRKFRCTRVYSNGLFLDSCDIWSEENTSQDNIWLDTTRYKCVIFVCTYVLYICTYVWYILLLSEFSYVCFLIRATCMYVCTSGFFLGKQLNQDTIQEELNGEFFSITTI